MNMMKKVIKINNTVGAANHFIWILASFKRRKVVNERIGVNNTITATAIKNLLEKAELNMIKTTKTVLYMAKKRVLLSKP